MDIEALPRRPRGKRFTPEEILDYRQRVEAYRQANPNTSVEKLCKDLGISNKVYYTHIAPQGPLPPKVRTWGRPKKRVEPSYQKIDTTDLPIFNTQETVTAYVFKGSPDAVRKAMEAMR